MHAGEVGEVRIVEAQVYSVKLSQLTVLLEEVSIQVYSL